MHNEDTKTLLQNAAAALGVKGVTTEDGLLLCYGVEGDSSKLLRL